MAEAQKDKVQARDEKARDNDNAGEATEKDKDEEKAPHKDSADDTANQSIAVMGRYGTFKTSGSIEKDSKEAKRKVTISKLDEAWHVLRLAIRNTGKDQYFWLAALMITTAARIWLVKFGAHLAGQINRAIYARDRVSFKETLKRRVVVCIFALGTTEAAQFFQGRLAQLWHIGITRMIHDHYFGNQMFYHLGRANILDADQRIAVDAQETLVTIATIAEKFVSVAGLGTYFTASVYREMGLMAASAPWLFMYAMRKVTDLVPLDWRRLAGLMEYQFGLYRGQHNRLVQHGEAVAALQGAALEGTRLREFLEKTEQAQRFFWNALTTFIISQSFCSRHAPRIFAPVVVLWPFLKNPQTTSETMTVAGYQVSLFLEAMTATGTLTSSLLDLQRVGGNAKRVTDLLAAFEKINSDQAEANTAFRQGTNSIEFSGVQVVTPTGHTLVEDLSFSVTKGSNLMITGHNGAGKSSIFRCLGGLWRIPRGTITKPGSGSGLHGDVFYIPQKPYNLVGTLVEQVTYPKIAATLSSTDLGELLQIVDLKYLLQREGEVDWERALSLGEQQRLAMVRLLFHSPKFAVLDECTSAVSAEMERRFYTYCAERSITCITISHRPALQQFHQRMLALDGKKGYKIEVLVKEQQAEVRQAAVTGAGALLDAPAQIAQNKSFATHVRQITRLMSIAKPKNFELKLLKSVAIASANTAIGNAYSVLMAGLYSTMLKRDTASFRWHAAGLCLWAIGQSCTGALSRVNQCHLGTDLRMQISRNLLERYLDKSGFYRLKNMQGSKDGPHVPDPETRLGVDVREWAVNASSFCTTLPTLLFETLWWGYALKKVAGARYALAIYAYAAVASITLRTVIPSFRSIRERENALDGKYRSEHASVLASAESIAFFGGGDFEREVVERRFRQTMELKKDTIGQNSRYKFVSSFLFTVIPTHAAFAFQDMLAQQVSEGAMLGAVQQKVVIGVERLFDSLALMQEFVETFQKFIGGSNRLYDLVEVLDGMPSVGDNTSASDDIVFQGVDLTTPAGVCLARGLDFQVKKGEPLMITGPNGCGKSSFFRVLGGLWSTPGRLYRPVRGLDVFLVPQKPFLTSPGTLAEQVTYPDSLPKEDLTEELKARLRGHMEAVGLLDLLDREGWDTQAKDNALSLGEQQRLGMARLFYHRPAFAVLDECTSAVSAEVEVRMYAHAHSLNITMITLSQRLALKEFHKRELQMGLPDAGWALLDI